MTVRELKTLIDTYIDYSDKSNVYVYDGIEKIELESDMVRYYIDENGNEILEFSTF